MMSDMREELEQLRQQVNELMARFPAGVSPAWPADEFGGGSSGRVNQALVRHLEAEMASEGKTRGIAICRIVVSKNDGGISVRSSIITHTRAEDFQKPTKLRESVVALATDPLALRAVRKLVEPYFDGKLMRMTKTELAAALDASEVEIENSLRPLVSDRMILWSKTADGEEAYEIQDGEPHVLLIQSLE
jgi:hypothetical protein